MTETASVFVWGEALIDFLSQPELGPSNANQSFRAIPGGSPYNTAIAAARTGVTTHFIGSLSTDLFGAHLFDHMIAQGVCGTFTPRTTAQTMLAFVTIASGEPRYAFFSAGSTLEQPHLKAPTQQIRPGDILAIGSIALVPESAASAIEAIAIEQLNPQATLAIDPNVRPQFISDHPAWRQRIDRLMRRADIVKLSEVDLACLRPGMPETEFTHEQFASGTALVVISRAKAGASAFARAGAVHLPAGNPIVTDTVGAGDTLMGAMLAWLVREGWSRRDVLSKISIENLGEMLGYAVAAAGLTCQTVGCQPPDHRAILRALGRP